MKFSVAAMTIHSGNGWNLEGNVEQASIRSKKKGHMHGSLGTLSTGPQRR